MILSKNKEVRSIFRQNRLFRLKLRILVKKTKNRAKNRIFHIFKLKFGKSDDFSTYIWDKTYKKWFSPKTKKLGPFFVKYRLFRLKLRILVKKTKNWSKNRIFYILKMKFGVSDEFYTYISEQTYKKWFYPKIKQLGPFFAKNCLFQLKLRILVKKRNIDLKIVYLTFSSWNSVHPMGCPLIFQTKLRKNGFRQKQKS